MATAHRLTRLALVALVVLAGLAWYLQNGSTVPDEPADLPAVEVGELPGEAGTTLELIDAGGPFPYPDDDGKVFGNREALLPDQPSGYYHEYTVPTPGSDDRGARRIVTGGDIDRSSAPTEFYWTDDHYRSFERIER